MISVAEEFMTAAFTVLLEEFGQNLNNDDDDDDLVFYIPFNIIEVISRQLKSDNEKFCAMMHHRVMTPTGVEPGT